MPGQDNLNEVQQAAMENALNDIAGVITAPAKPSVGRIVHFNFPQHEAIVLNNNLKVAPAIIVRVWSDTCVNLKVLTDGVHDIWKTSIDQGDQPNQWNWPPLI